jgi:ABC-type nitrate/sulfonate/bicarbonate transport system permease component
MMARRLARSIARASTRILLPAALGILWEKAHVLFGVPTYLIPPPSALYATLLAEFPSLLRHTRITTAAAL